MNKNITVLVIVAVVVGGLAFYGGSMYEKSSTPVASATRGAGRGAGYAGGAGGAGGGAAAGGGASAGGFVSGQVLSHDDTSVTVQLTGGGSKIVFYTASTTIMKTTSGSVDDLQPGTSVVVTGTANQDGSVSAKSIQLRDGSSGFGNGNANQ